MRVLILTCGVMMAFAANSVLNRMAVGPGLIDPVGFAVVRLVAGAVILLVLLAARRVVSGRAIWPDAAGRLGGVLGLLAYLFAFSFAYRALDAGVGALILFGLVQITMFGGAVLAREAVPARRWIGAAVAFGGLIVLLAPGGAAGSVVHAGAMALAGIGWGIYSLAGRRARDPLAATAANFTLALPFALPALFFWGDLSAATHSGLWLAVICGAVTSGLGYALWYLVVPGLGASRAGVAQLSVPVIAAFAGAVWLAEPLGLRFILSSLLVLGGVALASAPSRKPL